MSWSAVAAAEPPGLTPAEAPQPATIDVPSYRLQTALADAAVIGVGLLASTTNGSDGGGVGAALSLGGYLLAAPIVHLAHDHGDRAVESFALRIGVPLLGGLIGNAVGRSQCSFNCDNDADIALTALGIVTGAVAASAIDIGYLSRGDTITRTGPRLAPAVATGPNGSVRIGIGGTF
ncbi:MAG TPA: hypothetical protein VFQ65_15265 [Kofleriaceae bacterium]|nr:hypothetical protein [Kofleriaceae bacterium]